MASQSPTSPRSPSWLRNGVLIQRQAWVLLRNPLNYLIFCAVLLVVMGGFSAAYHSLASQTYRVDQFAGAGQSLLASYQLNSLLAILLITPIIGVQAIAQERMSGTLDLILTAAVHPLDFVLSKLAAAFIVIVTAIIGMAPVLSVLILMGGVGPGEVAFVVFLQLFFVTISLLIGAGVGAMFPRLIQGIVVSYCFVGSVALFFWLFLMFAPRPNLFALIPGLLAGGLLAFALAESIPRQITREFNRVRPKSWKPMRLKGVDMQLWSLLGTREYGDPIGPRENPVYVSERERFHAMVVRRGFDAPSVLWLASILFTLTALYPAFLLQIALLLGLVFVPMSGSSAFSSEHENRSWASLRGSLLSTAQIIGGKLRLTLGQGLIHVFSFLVPPLMILAVIWGMISIQHENEIYHFNADNAYWVWMGHLLNLPVILLAVLFTALLSLWISTRFHRTFPAMLTAYLSSAAFFYLPWFFHLFDPANQGQAANGAVPFSIYSALLAIWHGPFLFDLWPASVQNRSIYYPRLSEFWALYGQHLLFMTALCLLLYLAINWQVRRMDGSIHD